MKSVNILITGSNYWNPGDDIVREGVMALLRALLFPRPINWHFHNFAQSRMTGPCGEVANTVDILDLTALAPHLDLVVIPGLAFGRELYQFQARLVDLRLGPKTFFIGGMNENSYAAQCAGFPGARQLLREAPVVISRTRKVPDQFNTDGIKYHVLPCPSILCDWMNASAVDGGGVPPEILMSIQLPHGHARGVVNHTTSLEAHNAAMGVLKATKSPVRLVCHHKSEFEIFAPLFKGDSRVDVVFSSWFQDEWMAYKTGGIVASTRLHSVLWCRAMGIPGIIVNDSERHVHALEQFPRTPHTLEIGKALQYLEDFREGPTRDEWVCLTREHQRQTWDEYIKILEPHVRHLKIP